MPQAQAIRAITGTAPLMLLDEISAHLDKARRQALFSLLEDLKVQAWMTGTDSHVFDGASPSTVVYHVENGAIRESP